MEESVEQSCACREMIHQFMEEFGIGGVQMGESFTKSQYRAFILTDFVQVRQSLSRYFDSHFSTGSSADDCEITHALYCLLWGEKLEPSEPSCLKTVLDPVPLPRLAQKYSGDTIFSRTEDIKNEDRFNTTFHCPANFMPFPRGSFNVQRQRSFKEGKYESFLYFAQEIEEILDNKTGPKYGAVQYLARENLNNADIEKAVNDAGLQWFYGFVITDMRGLLRQHAMWLSSIVTRSGLRQTIFLPTFLLEKKALTPYGLTSKQGRI
jgi:hypothetical protein